MTTVVGDDVMLRPIALDLPLAHLDLTFGGFDADNPEDLLLVEASVQVLQEKFEDAERPNTLFEADSAVYSVEYGKIKSKSRKPNADP